MFVKFYKDGKLKETRWNESRPTYLSLLMDKRWLDLCKREQPGRNPAPRTLPKSLVVNIPVIKKVRDFVITEVSFF